MIGDPGSATPTNPFGIPGLDTILPSLPGLPGVTPPSNGGNGQGPSLVGAQAVENAYASLDAANQLDVAGYVSRNGAGRSVAQHAMVIGAAAGLAAGAALVFLIFKR